MFSKNINFRNFYKNKNNKKIRKEFNFLVKENIEVIKSLGSSYKYKYKKKLILSLKKFTNIRVIGMGGSILATEAIYNFLKKKINKKFFFVNNIKNEDFYKKKDKNFLNLIVSKSGNTLETISNLNILLNKKDKNIFITEKKNSYIFQIAHQLKSEIIEHNNFIGGRYSVLSEVGMLPSELMGLNVNQFKQFNNLIKNKKFITNLISNVDAKLKLLKQGKSISVILNYDEDSDGLLRWYQQLVAESLGKKSKGILPVISTMPRDNHSLMQLYLDGPKKYFFTFFYVFNKDSIKINELSNNKNFIKNKTLDEVKYAQKLATERVFFKKKIPFRSFEIINRNEKTMGELFVFFILETILLGRMLKVNPFDQPSVELIKQETNKILF